MRRGSSDVQTEGVEGVPETIHFVMSTQDGISGKTTTLDKKKEGHKVHRKYDEREEEKKDMNIRML